MVNNYSDIIDNRNVFLKDRVNAFLSASEEAKFAVGYFFLSGFNEIIKNVADLKEVKIILGTTSNIQTVEEIAEGISQKEQMEEIFEERRYQKRTDKEEIAKNIKSKMTDNIEHLDQSEENENMLLRLKDLIANGKVKIKVYTKYRLHSKAYLFKYKKNETE